MVIESRLTNDEHLSSHMKDYWDRGEFWGKLCFEKELGF